MYITDLKLRTMPDSIRVEARVIWETVRREPLQLFAETDVDCPQGFWADPNAFLAVCALPAWHAGEERVFVDGGICPILAENMQAVFGTLRNWYPELGQPPVIGSPSVEAKSPFAAEAASFLSCGIDSLATLRSNHCTLPRNHPGLIRSVLVMDYLKEYGLSKEETAHQAAKRQIAASRVASDLGVEVVPVRTNIMRLDKNGHFFSYKWHGATLIFAAHLFSQKFSKVYLASSGDAANLAPWGSHPLLDPYMGSAHLQIEHHGIGLTRFEKTAVVADWPAGLNNIIVCQGRKSGETNCGACEKCIRTMTALVAQGKLASCNAFPVTDVSRVLLGTVCDYDMIYKESQIEYYRELKAPLVSVGREDLAETIDRILEYARDKDADADSANVAAQDYVQGGRLFVCVDREQFGGLVRQQTTGQYWGPPPDAETALRELGALIRSGADYLVITERGMWWLDYFGELNQYLRDRFHAVHDNSKLVVFELKNTRN